MAQAVAYLFGAGQEKQITGMVRFADVADGYTKLEIDVKGLPDASQEWMLVEKGKTQPVGLLPPLIPSEKRARMSFYTKQFPVSAILGGNVILYKGRGQTVASGTIRRVLEGKSSYAQTE